MMKKLIMAFVMVFVLAFAGVCSAADGSVLNRQQVAAEKFMSAFGAAAPAYTEVQGVLGGQLKDNFSEQVYADLQKQVKEKFGSLKETKFFSFQRFDQADQIVYIASFSREKLVSMVFIFNKDNKVENFSFTKLEAKEENKAEAK